MFERLLEDLGFQCLLTEHGRLAAEQQKLARFLHWIHHSYLEKSKPAVFHPQLLAEFHTIEELELRMHGEFKALPAVSAPSATSRRQVKSRFGATPCRRATKLTVMPGSKVSSTIRTPLSSADGAEPM